MLNKLTKFWKTYGFEIILGLAILIILIYAFFRMGKKGTWDNFVFIPEKQKMPKKDSKGEIECRRVLENIFNRPFKKSRPDFLRNQVTKNFNLELDCYNPELKLACEYQGVQHYKYVPYFHKNKDAFQNQQYRDYMKRDLCEKNGIKLIEVPYNVKIEEIEQYIKEKLKS